MFKGRLLLPMLSGLLSVAAAELFLRTLVPVADPHAGLKRRPEAVLKYIPSAFRPHLALSLRAEEGLPGMPSAAVRFMTNNVGFRGDSLAVPKPAGEFRVFVIGGSTTECLYLDDSTTMPAKLQQRLQALAPPATLVRVYNAGKSGDKSFDHVAMLAHRIAHLEPDLVVVFPGINDLRAQISDADYLFVPPARSPEADRWSLFQLIKLAATEFQIGRRIQILVHRDKPREQQQQITLTSRYRKLAALQEAAPESNSLPLVTLAAYRQNLESMIGISSIRGVPIVFMTQATSWNGPAADPVSHWHWMGLFGDTAYTERMLDSAMSLYNGEARAVAAAHQVPVLDLATMLPKTSRYFYDDVHFNVRGADTTAGLLADLMARSRVLRFEASRLGTPDPVGPSPRGREEGSADRN